MPVDFDALFGSGFQQRYSKAVDDLRLVERQRATLLRSELAAIAEARRLGLSWAEIGAALGISRQAAHRRGRKLEGGRRRG